VLILLCRDDPMIFFFAVSMLRTLFSYLVSVVLSLAPFSNLLLRFLSVRDLGVLNNFRVQFFGPCWCSYRSLYLAQNNLKSPASLFFVDLRPRPFRRSFRPGRVGGPRSFFLLSPPPPFFRFFGCLFPSPYPKMFRF